MKVGLDPGTGFVGATELVGHLAAYVASVIDHVVGGGASPEQAELAATFGVSRMTARQAVKALEADGLVYRVPGAGTFSSGAEKHRSMGQLRSFTSEMSEKGWKVRSRPPPAAMK